ncbi:MAG: PAS domain S-box protein [Methylohalobius sp. ZOD2]
MNENETPEAMEKKLTEQYTEALRDYLAGAEEEAVQRTYRIGRRTAEKKATLSSLAAAHHEMLAKLLSPLVKPQPDASADIQDTLHRASIPWKAVLQGYEAAVKTLRQAHKALESQTQKHVTELAEANETLAAEIMERKLAEMALQDSEARFRVIFERAGIGMSLLDRDGKVRESNQALERMFGYSKAELHGKVLFELTHSEDKVVSIRLFQELVAGKHTHYKLEKRFIKRDGSLLWARKIVSGVYGVDGELQFAIDMIEDITESKRVEMALRESEARFRQIADMTGEWIWEQDETGRYIYSSAAVAEILGYRPEEIIGKYYYDLFTPEDRKRIAVIASETIAQKETFHSITNRYQHKKGYEVYTESTGTPILDSHGKILKWRGVDHDITERKRFEDELRLRDRAIEASSVGIIITDAHQPGNPIIYANPAFTEITGYSREELIGRNPRLLQGPETDPEANEEIRQAVQEGRDCHLTLKNYRKDGTPFWNELLISPVRDEDGKLTHYVGTQTDVTELRRVEEQRHEMEIAKQIQLSLLPPAPLHKDGIQVAGFCLPAAHVGGDYYDYFSLKDTVDLVIADVSGHSVGAAMIMAETRCTLKMKTLWLMKESTGVANTASANLAILNELLFEDLNRAELFITMFYAQYHIASRKLSYANAGHNRPLLLRRGESLELDTDGLILGVSKEVTFEEKQLTLEDGDVLLLYTDGITEAQNKSGEFFGEARLKELATAHAQASPQAIIDAVIQELEAFCQSQSFHDDISLLVLKVA